MYGHRIIRWERLTEWPLTIAAVLFLVVYATEILVRPEGVGLAVCEAILWATWCAFAVDYVARLIMSRNRGRWFLRHLLDLAIVVLPMLRPLRLMRLLTVVAILGRGTGTMLRGRVLIYTLGATILLAFISALAVLDAEREVGGTIATFGDALWWAVVTITTVGYGDFVPTSVTGRSFAVVLMVGGIAVIGVVTATLASWIVERIADQTTETTAATEHQVEELRREVGELKDLIQDLRAAVSSALTTG